MLADIFEGLLDDITDLKTLEKSKRYSGVMALSQDIKFLKHMQTYLLGEQITGFVTDADGYDIFVTEASNPYRLNAEYRRIETYLEDKE